MNKEVTREYIYRRGKTYCKTMYDVAYVLGDVEGMVEAVKAEGIMDLAMLEENNTHKNNKVN